MPVSTGNWWVYHIELPSYAAKLALPLCGRHFPNVFMFSEARDSWGYYTNMYKYSFWKWRCRIAAGGVLRRQTFFQCFKQNIWGYYNTAPCNPQAKREHRNRIDFWIFSFSKKKCSKKHFKKSAFPLDFFTPVEYININVWIVVHMFILCNTILYLIRLIRRRLAKWSPNNPLYQHRRKCRNTAVPSWKHMRI